MMAANGAGSSSSGGAGLGNSVMTALAGSSSSSNTSTVPPGFRFHPTDEELLYYYLRKKVSYEAIDLDVIREVDLNKLEPWDLKDKCRIGSGPQNEWYFFSHKDKKYPTGTRTNRATAAGFWKATGRDKPIHHHSSSSNSSKRIGMRKTLVFYIGRAPHGRKTDWIMHEYRLDDQDSINNFHHITHHHHELEDGWVVCRVFKKKNNIPTNGNTSSTTSRGFQQPDHHHDDHHQLSDMNDHEENFTGMMMKTADHQKQNPLLPLYGYHHETAMQMQQQTMHLPQLLSPESMQQHHHHIPSSFLSAGGANVDEIGQFYGHHSQSLLSLTPGSSSVAGDWSFLDKLLASGHQNVDEMHAKSHSPLMPSHHDMVNSGQRFPLIPFQFSEPGCFKFSK